MKKKLLLTLIVISSWLTMNAQGIEFKEHQNQIDVMIDGKLFTSYLTDPTLLKPCLYPVISPSGEMMTRRYPFEEVEGESKDHPHHTGVYFTYGSNGEVNGNSFWNRHEIPPQIKHIKVLEKSDGKDHATLSTISHWIGSGGKVILEEARKMIFSQVSDGYAIDFDIALKATDDKVVFKDTKEGMFAIRVADWLTEQNKGTLEQGTGEYLNAEGLKTEKNIWGKKSAWVRLEGEREAQKIGVAIYHHPGSLNFPTYWHARGYGCFSANPIGQYDFEKGRVANAGSRQLELAPGEEAVFKFRMVIYEGERKKKDFDQEFKNYSKS